MASYINLGLLWMWLRRAGVYQRRAGWGGFVLRLLLACAAMAAVVGTGLHWLPDFTVLPKLTRVLGLLGLVAAGGLTYGVVQVALGLRPRDLRGH